MNGEEEKLHHLLEIIVPHYYWLGETPCDRSKPRANLQICRARSLMSSQGLLLPRIPVEDGALEGRKELRTRNRGEHAFT